MTEETARKLNKTLTFGLGVPLGFEVRTEELLPLSDEERKTVYIALSNGSETFAMICNVLTAKEYSRRVLGVPKKQLEEFSTSYIPIKNRLDRKTALSGAILSQTYVLGSNPHFQGEHGKDLLERGKRQLPTHRTDGTHPIMMRAKETRLLKRDKQFYLASQVFSMEWSNETNISNWIAFPIKVEPRDKTMASQLERVHAREWKLKNSRLRKNPRSTGKYKWLGQIVVEYEPEPYKQIDPEIVMGIDLGVTVPAVLHIRDHGNPQAWAMCIGRGRDMLNTRATIRSQIVRLIRALRSKDSPLDAKSKAAAKEKLRDLRKSEKRVMKTASQRIAARIGEVAKRNGAGTWQMEKLGADIKEDKPWLARNWAPGAVVDAVRWQAQQVGAELKMIDPRYTSQRCSKCGHIDRANRPKGAKKQAHFECVECHHKENADKNAARNISTPNIEEIIREARPPDE
jgi:transposase